MSEEEKAWDEFIKGNPELIAGFKDALGLVFTGCSNDVVEEDITEDVTAVWTVTINDVSITDLDAAKLEVITQTLQKQDKEGNLSDQECVGYTLADLLEYAEVGEITTLTVTASDGYAYELTADVALLPTTMLVFEQDGVAYEKSR